jgi:hypothetical protein
MYSDHKVRKTHPTILVSLSTVFSALLSLQEFDNVVIFLVTVKDGLPYLPRESAGFQKRSYYRGPLAMPFNIAELEPL